MSKALVTGGGQGIGAAICRELAAAGWRVAVHTRTPRPGAHQLVAELPGDSHALVHGDIADPVDAAGIVTEAIAALGGLDLVVNNAGLYLEGAAPAVTYADWQSQWQRVISANVIGTANVCFAAIEHFMNRPEGPDGGRVINVGSRGAYRGEPNAPAYGASKAAVHSLTQSLAASVGAHGIGVAGVAPGFVHTELARERLEGASGAQIMAQSPFGRVGAPNEVASAVAWLASPDALWASGTIIDLNGASYFR